MWPGSSSIIKNARPTYYDPYDSRITLDQKVDRVMEWLDMDYEERPQLIGLYVSEVDSAGHEYGPNSRPINNTLLRVDSMVHNIMQGLKMRNLTEIVNVIIVLNLIDG